MASQDCITWVASVLTGIDCLQRYVVDYPGYSALYRDFRQASGLRNVAKHLRVTLKNFDYKTHRGVSQRGLEKRAQERAEIIILNAQLVGA